LHVSLASGLEIENAPCATLFDFGKVELQQIVQPSKQLLPDHDISPVISTANTSWSYLDSPILDDD